MSAWRRPVLKGKKMKSPKALFAGIAASALLAAFAAHALPFDDLKLGADNPLLTLTGSHEHGDHDRMSANGCANSEDDGDDDEGGANCMNGGGMMQQNATPPANGLFAPGAKSQSQVN